MSNLILPSHLVNQMLEDNLKAFFNRYPYERERLEPVLRKPAPMFPLKPFVVPDATEAKPPMRIILLCAIGNPQFLAGLLNDKTVIKENFKLFIFEQDPEFLAFCFQYSDFSQIINHGKTEWFLYQTVDSVKPMLYRALKPEAVTSVLLNVQVLTQNEIKEEDQAYYDKVPDLYHETAQHVLHNHGNLDDSLLGIEITLRNKKYVTTSPGILDLKDYYKGCSALIVGAGPSLDQNLETIKKYNDRFVVIAADAALKPLMNAGIRVDYITSIERLNAYQKPFFEGLEKVDADLVAFPVVHPEVLDSYPGRVRIVYRNYSFFAYFEKAYPKGILKCGGSTSHLALRLAEYMGCRRTFMIGLDSTYEEKEGLYRSHCSGTGHPEWGEFIPLNDFVTKRKHLPPIEAVNNLGKSVATNITYYQWIKELSEELAYIGQTMQLKNCSATGLKMDGIDYIPLEEAAKNLQTMIVEKPVNPPVPFNRAWSNKELKKNFQGWLEMANAGIAECDELLKMEEIDLDRYQALFYLQNFRMFIDDLFVAFVVQCAAFKWFHLENKRWALNIDADKDLKPKTMIFRDFFTLFKITLERLIAMIEKENEDVSSSDS